VSIQTQLVTMALMVACGMTMGLLYDTYRVMKGQTGIRGWLVIICDLLFWASCTFLVFGTLLRINEGIVRVYLFLGMGIGAWLYFVIFQAVYVKWFLRLINLVKAIYRFIVRTIHVLIIMPIIFLYKTILAIIIGITLFIWRIFLFLYNILHRMFSPVGRQLHKQGTRIYSSSKKKGAGIMTRLAKLFKRKNKRE
jgi:spore cortex biosynthesis protein YabQ